MTESDEHTAAMNKENFKTLFEEYDFAPLKKGEMVEGRVIQFDQDSILIDVGTKFDAVVPRRDFSRIHEDDLERIEEGDRVEVAVLKPPRRGGELLVSLSQGLAQSDWERAAELHESEEPIEVEITGYNRGGLVTEFGYLRGFIPNSHFSRTVRLKGSKGLDSIKHDAVGTSMTVRVIEADPEQNRLVLSAKEAEKSQLQQRFLDLKKIEGSIVEGEVVNLTEFGAFVALGGVDGLIHKSELSWDTIDHPREVIEVGDQVTVKIMGVDVDRQRISLSLKALEPGPWEDIQSEMKEGELIQGVVTNLVHFGAFVRLPVGVEGLVHESQMEIIGHDAPKDIIAPGDEILVRIIDIDPERQRIGLSMIEVTYDEYSKWIQNRKASEKDSSAAPEEV